MLLQANALRIPLADESVHCVVTSPPYWGLRSYFGTAVWVDGDPICDHFIDLGDGGSIKDDDFETPFRTGKQYTHQKVYRDTCGKCGAVRIDAQLGLEATIEEYCANMVAVFREVKRVLRSDGVCWINLGDAFLNKQLIGAPWRVAFALQADGWWLRSDCIWAKPNPMPESVTDRPTKSHEYIFLLTKSANYFYDADAVREPLKDDPETYIKKSTRKNPTAVGSALQSGFASRENGFNKYLVDKDIYVPAGRNLRSVWTIATAPYSGAHFATFAPALVERCIRAGTSERGACPECGKQWERETSLTPEYKAVLESGKSMERCDR